MIGTPVGLLTYPTIGAPAAERWSFANQVVTATQFEPARQVALVENEAYERLVAANEWTLTNRNVLLPEGAHLAAVGGWEPSRWDPAMGGRPLGINGLNSAETLFGTNGKFAFDHVLGTAIDPDNVIQWLLTEAGWVKMVYTPESREVAQFHMYADELVGFRPTKTLLADNKLYAIEDDEAPQLHWNLDEQEQPQRTTSPESSFELIMTRPNVDAYYRLFGSDGITIFNKAHNNRQIDIRRASHWYWPVELLGIGKRQIDTPLAFTQSNNDIWVCDPHRPNQTDWQPTQPPLTTLSNNQADPLTINRSPKNFLPKSSLTVTPADKSTPSSHTYFEGIPAKNSKGNDVSIIKTLSTSPRSTVTLDATLSRMPTPAICNMVDSGRFPDCFFRPIHIRRAYF